MGPLKRAAMQKTIDLLDTCLGEETRRAEKAEAEGAGLRARLQAFEKQWREDARRLKKISAKHDSSIAQAVADEDVAHADQLATLLQREG